MVNARIWEDTKAKEELEVKVNDHADRRIVPAPVPLLFGWTRENSLGGYREIRCFETGKGAMCRAPGANAGNESDIYLPGVIDTDSR